MGNPQWTTLDSWAFRLGFSKISEARRRGDAARDRLDWPTAASEYQIHLAMQPQDFAIWVQLGHALKEGGHSTQALAAYETALRLTPNDADLLLNMGHLYRQLGEREKASAFYLRSAEQDGNSRALFELRKLGVRAPSPAALPSPIAPSVQGKSRALGNAARDRRDWLAASTHYRRHLQSNPDDFAIWVQLGHVLKEHGELIAALSSYGEALRLNAQDADLLLNTGRLYRLMGHAKIAVEYFQRSAARDGNLAALAELNGLTQLTDPRRIPDTASPPPTIDAATARAMASRANFSIGRRVRGLWSPPYKALGDAARGRREWPLAAQLYRLHVARRPDHFAIWVQLGHALKESGRPHEALGAYHEAYHLDAHDSDLSRHRNELQALIRLSAREAPIDAPPPPTELSHSPEPFAAPNSPRTEFDRLPIVEGERRILIVDSGYPTPNRDSGSLDAINFIRIFKSLGYGVYFLSVMEFFLDSTDPLCAESYDQLAQMGVVVIDWKYGESIHEFVRMNGGYFDLAFLSRVYCGGEVYEQFKRHSPRTRIVFNTVDLHHIRERRESQFQNDLVQLNQSYWTEARELYLTRLSDATIVVSDIEAQILRQAVPAAKVRVFPLIRDMPGRSNGYHERNGVGFVGGFRHTPNIDAVNYFLDEIWPLVRQALPDLTFSIIGADVPDSLRLRTDEGLKVTGYVESLTPALEQIRLTVAPLRFGAGAKGKVVSSLSHGVPCVGTPVAAEGMGLGEAEGVLVAENPAGFADMIVKAYQSEALWETLSQSGLAYVSQHYSMATGTDLVRALFAEIDLARPEA